MRPSGLVLPGARSIKGFDTSLRLLLNGMPVPDVNTVSSKIPFQFLFNSSTPKYIDRIKAHLLLNSQQAMAVYSSVNGTGPVIRNKLPIVVDMANSLEELQTVEQRRTHDIVAQVQRWK